VPFGLAVEEAHEESVGEDHPGRLGVGLEEAEGCPLSRTRVVLGELFQIFFDKRYWSQFWQTCPVSP
jgi:hypothetical protein